MKTKRLRKIIRKRAASASVRLETWRKWLGVFSISRMIRWSLYVFVVWWVYANWHNNRSLERLTQRYAYPESYFIELDGMKVHCRETGKGPALLLLHDAGSSLHTWQGWHDSLSAKNRVISIDLPGAGLTGPHPLGSYSAFMYAGFIDSLADRLALKRFSLAGVGLGAQVAWHYASEAPRKASIDRLILLDAPGFEARGRGWVQTLARTPVIKQLLWKITPRFFIRLMLEEMYADDGRVNDALIDRHFELMLRPGNRKAFTDRAAVGDNRPPADLIDRIAAPTMILWGAEDARISPEHAYDFHRRIRGAVLKIYSNTGHWPQEENPAGTARDVQAFLEGRF